MDERKIRSLISKARETANSKSLKIKRLEYGLDFGNFFVKVNISCN